MNIGESIYEGVIVAALTIITDMGIRKVIKNANRTMTIGTSAVVAVSAKKYAMEKGWIKPIA